MSAPARVKATASTPIPDISIRLPPRGPRKLSGVGFITSSAVLPTGTVSGVGQAGIKWVGRSGISIESRHDSQDQHQQEGTSYRQHEPAGAGRHPYTSGGPDRGGCGEATYPVAFLGHEDDS